MKYTPIIKIALLLVLLNLLLTEGAFAQAPQGFNYQAIVRNSAGVLITNQIVGFKFSIKQTSASGTTVYSETQYVTPDNLGQVSLVVGTGTPSTGTFATINWASGTYYLAIELNTGTGFVAMGTTQLLSVPYALYANSAGGINLPNGSNVGDVLNWVWNGTNWVPTASASKVPVTPSNLNGEVTSTRQINLSWIDNSTNETGFKIERKVSGGEYTLIGTTEADNTNFSDSGLSLGVTYTYRVYAYNAVGTSLTYAYSLEIKTANVPVLTTTLATLNFGGGASSGGNITDNSGSDVTARGVAWSTNSNPTIDLSTKTVDGSGSGVFTSAISGLTAGTTYYIRAYATNGAGTAYGNQITFTETPDDYTVLKFADEFNTDGAPDPLVWSYDLGTGNNGWGNAEEQNYTNNAKNVKVEGGNLVITAIKESSGSKPYSSARIKTQGKYSFKYGKIEIRAKFPTGVGTWPAVWSLGSNFNTVSWPACGEIDFVEHVGKEQDKIFGSLHYPGNSGGNAVSGTKRISNASTEFHVYKVIWNSNTIRFYVDDILYKTASNASALPFNQDFFLIANVAMGGNFGGPITSTFTQSSMFIDYIRVYQ